jgi:predicted TIM-barrel enzyme
MGNKFSRSEIIGRLKQTVESKKPIIAAGASAGIIARAAERGGADLIMVYSSGKTRLRGEQTSFVEDSNNITMEMIEEMAEVVEHTPIVAGIEATEPPPERELEGLIQRALDAGASGVINFPTMGFMRDREYRKEKDDEGLGFKREVELVRTSRNMDVFSMAYVFYPGDARAMAKAGVDCLVPHVGGTGGGEVGYDAMSHREAAARINKMTDSAKKVRDDLVFLGHGGPFASPRDTTFLYEHTDCKGFVGASSIERIPVERAVKLVVLEFKNVL